MLPTIRSSLFSSSIVPKKQEKKFRETQQFRSPLANVFKEPIFHFAHIPEKKQRVLEEQGLGSNPEGGGGQPERLTRTNEFSEPF